MNQKQLANVLVKILGLSLCAHSVTSVFMAMIGAVGFQALARNYPAYLTSLVVALLPFAIGVYFIVQSRWVADKLFRDE